MAAGAPQGRRLGVAPVAGLRGRGLPTRPYLVAPSRLEVGDTADWQSAVRPRTAGCQPAVSRVANPPARGCTHDFCLNRRRDSG